MTNSRKEPFRRSLARRRFSLARRGYLRGSTIINVVAALIFFGLIGLGVWWVIKTVGQAGQQYTEVVIDTQYRAETVRCQTNLRAIWQNLQMIAVTEGEFPSSLEGLVQWSGNSRLFQCPALEGENYVYIPGQTPDMSPQNVLLYESKAVHEGRCSVLRLGGQIELLTPEELQAAVANTLKELQ